MNTPASMPLVEAGASRADVTLVCSACGDVCAARDAYCARCGALQRDDLAPEFDAADLAAVTRARHVLVAVSFLSAMIGLYVTWTRNLGAAVDDLDIGAVRSLQFAQIILTVTMAWLAHWSQKQPLAALLAGAGVFASIQATRFLDAEKVANLAVLIVPGLMFAGLVAGVLAVLRARARARARRPACAEQPRWGSAFCSGCGVKVPAGARDAHEAGVEAHRDAASGEVSAVIGVAFAFAVMTGTTLVLKERPAGISVPWLFVGATVLDAVLLIPLLGFGLLDRMLALRRFGLTDLGLTGLSATLMWLTLDPWFAAMRRAEIPFLAVLPHFRGQDWSLGATLVVVALMPAVLEEIVFRGLLFVKLRRFLTAHQALIVQAMLFSVLHFIPLSFPSHLLMGLIFGALRLRTGSLYPSMVLHGFWNAWVTVTE